MSLIYSISFGQAYFANGDARAIGGQCYELTANRDWQLGSVWYANKLSLNKDFDLEFYLNFGSTDADGADGIVFVMQTVGNKAIGLAGGGIGFEGFSPSLGVEFDTWQNVNFGDPVYDHIAVFKNGNINHNGATEISPQVAISTTSGNVEDVKDHLVRVRWLAKAQLFQVFVDCELRQNVSIDLIDDIFNGTEEVFWGFTSATGGSSNRHIACLRDDILVADTVPICKGESTLLNARESEDNTYRWYPSLGLSDTTIKRPSCNITVPSTYYVDYKDLCGDIQTDTVYIRIDQPFVMDEGEDSLLCDGDAYRIDLTTRYDSTLWTDGHTDLFRRILDAGSYRLRAWRGVCYDDDSFDIETHVSPSFEVFWDTTFCNGESLDVKTRVSPVDVVWSWDNGSTDSIRTFTESGNFILSGTNKCGDNSYFGSVERIDIPDFSFGTDSTLCEGDDILLDPGLDNTYRYTWSDGTSATTLTVNEGGSYWLEVEKIHCIKRDTIDVNEIQPPVLDLPSEIVLCDNERVELTVEVQSGSVRWQDGSKAKKYILVNEEGVFGVRVTNNCGTDTATINVDLEFCTCDLEFPNVFTPNNNNLNETFKPVQDCEKLTDYHLEVYSRWGERLFTSDDIELGWDAFFQDLEVQQDVYIWVCWYKGVEGGSERRKTATGTVLVLR